MLRGDEPAESRIWLRNSKSLAAGPVPVSLLISSRSSHRQLPDIKILVTPDSSH
jgi:hypothetical protein